MRPLEERAVLGRERGQRIVGEDAPCVLDLDRERWQQTVVAGQRPVHLGEGAGGAAGVDLSSRVMNAVLPQAHHGAARLVGTGRQHAARSRGRRVAGGQEARDLELACQRRGAPVTGRDGHLGDHGRRGEVPHDVVGVMQEPRIRAPDAVASRDVHRRLRGDDQAIIFQRHVRHPPTAKANHAVAKAGSG